MKIFLLNDAKIYKRSHFIQKIFLLLRVLISFQVFAFMARALFGGVLELFIKSFYTNSVVHYMYVSTYTKFILNLMNENHC